MVNNARIDPHLHAQPPAPVRPRDRVDLEHVFGVQLAAKQMIKQGGGGRIINISSIHEDWPMPGNSPFCAAKVGIRMLTRTAGVELAPHGITACACSARVPAPIDT